jgi:hypothetical protein
MATATDDLQIQLARSELSDKLDELRRRAKHVRTWMSPSTYWNMPILRFGVGFIAGFALGRRPTPIAAGRSPSILHAVVRAGLVAATASLVRRALDRDHE